MLQMPMTSQILTNVVIGQTVIRGVLYICYIAI